jgi:hypothetical protein
MEKFLPKTFWSAPEKELLACLAALKTGRALERASKSPLAQPLSARAS